MQEKPAKKSLAERLFEGGLWGSRFLVFLPVIAGVLSSGLLLIIAAGGAVSSVWKTIRRSMEPGMFSDHVFEKEIIAQVVGSLDMFLIGIVLLIFSFGIYELFISRVEPAKLDQRSSVLEVTSLDDLKNRIARVVIMALVVFFFQRVLETDFHTAVDLLALGGGVLALCGGLWLMKDSKE